VFYELGIRHAISTGLTVLIAAHGTPIPFDIAHQRVLLYPRDEPQSVAPALIAAVHARVDETANPVRSFLERLGMTTNASTDAAGFAQDLANRVERARTVEQLLAVWGWARNQAPLPALGLLQLAERLSAYSAWPASVEVLRRAVALRPDDFEIHRALGWHLRHLGSGSEAEALKEFERALMLNPHDPETLGMMGGLFKRQGRYAEAAKCYDNAARVSSTSAYIRVNLAAMRVLENPAAPEAGLLLYRELLEKQQGSIEPDPWAEVVAGEAAFALSRDDVALRHFRQAAALTRTGEELRSAADQLALFAKAGFRAEDAKRMSDEVRDLRGAPGSAPAASESALVSSTTAAAIPAVAIGAVGFAPVIIHLSDIHFGSKPSEKGPVAMHRFRDDDWERPLHEHLVSEFGGKSAHFKQEHDRFILVVSGDLTYQGSREEFKQVFEFLDSVCKSLKIPRERVFLVPGNHDVHWPSAKEDMATRFDYYLLFLRKFYGDALFRQRYPLVAWDFDDGSARPAPEDLIAIYRQDGLLIAGLNSCVYETEQHHYGFVGGRQLAKLKTLIEEAGGSAGDVRVAVLHHHLHPFPEPVPPRNKNSDEVWQDMSTIRDAGLVERNLEKAGFDLVLHGHKHKAQLRETLVHEQNVSKSLPPRLFVCGAGSAGVNGTELEHSVANHFAVIEFLQVPRRPGAEFIAVEWREIALLPGAEWTTSRRWVLNG
ncbi:MAG: metallophosphoesterase, partial [Burkholderiales bacterium]